MNIDELRNAIWEQLFQFKSSRSVSEIALHNHCDPATVVTACNHEWFTIADDRVAIAYATPKLHLHQH